MKYFAVFTVGGDKSLILEKMGFSNDQLSELGSGKIQ